MSLPFFPLYVDDFEADTAHLTLEEDGAYNRLLRLCWRTPGCSLPDDRNWIYRKVRARTDADKAAVDIVIDEFFEVEDGRVISTALARWESIAQKKKKRPHVPLAIQRAVYDRDGHRCKYCGCEDGPFHLDHVVPYARGGEHSIENLTVSCADCNWSKGSKTISEWRSLQ